MIVDWDFGWEVGLDLVLGDADCWEQLFMKRPLRMRLGFEGAGCADLPQPAIGLH